MEKKGSAITPKSSTNVIWKVSNEVLRPAGLVENQMKIIKNGKVIDNPKELSETFGTFFIDKVDGIVEEIKEQSQNEEKPFRCSHCDKKFGEVSGLTEYERTHKGELPLSCMPCDNNFEHASSLKEHENTQKVEVQFSCEHWQKIRPGSRPDRS